MRKLKHYNQLDYELNQIIVSNGAKQSMLQCYHDCIECGQ